MPGLPQSSPSGTPVGRWSARTASSRSPACCFLLSSWYSLDRPQWDSKKKKIYISIKTYKPCPNPLKQLKTTPSSLQHYWSSCCMLCGRFLSIMADKKNYLFSAFSQDELRIFHSSLQSDYPDKGESASGGIFCGAKKTMFAKFKTGTDLFQPSWSVLTFWFEAWSLQLCPITTLNHTYVVNTNWLIKQTPQ